MELDHLFVFVDGPSEAEEALTLLGLDETYRRVHPGQGTANVCCAFDDAYLMFGSRGRTRRELPCRTASNSTN
ncbi:MAG: VOC family protein [Myxococcales bacterium]|nr:VOC family protein [Myxococcales bacterium]